MTRTLPILTVSLTLALLVFGSTGYGEEEPAFAGGGDIEPEFDAYCADADPTELVEVYTVDGQGIEDGRNIPARQRRCLCNVVENLTFRGRFFRGCFRHRGDPPCQVELVFF